MSQPQPQPPATLSLVFEDKRAFFEQLDKVFKANSQQTDEDNDTELRELRNLFRNAKPAPKKAARNRAEVRVTTTTTTAPPPEKPVSTVTVEKTVQGKLSNAVTTNESRKPEDPKTPRPPLSSADVQVVPDTVLVRRHTSPVMSSKSKTRRKATEDAASSPAGARPGPGKRRKTEPVLPPKKQIFQNLKFFFIPNDFSKNKFRAKRRDNAIAHGAECLEAWSPTITHLIIDPMYNFSQALMYLKKDKISENIIVVNEDYQSDCVRFQRLVNPELIQYQVKGFLPPTPSAPPKEPTPEPLPSSSSSSSAESLVIKDKKRKHVEETPHDSSEQTPQEQQEEPKKQFEEVSEYKSLRIIKKVKEKDNLPTPVRPSISNVGKKDILDELIEIAKSGHAEFIEEANSDSEEISGDSDSERESSLPKNPRTELSRLRKNRNPEDFEKYFQCYQKHDGTEMEGNPNAHTIEMLSQLQKYYETVNDTWRSIGYRKAIATLKKQTTRVMWAKDAAKLPGIGERIAQKIEEIAVTNRLRRLEFAKQDSENNPLLIFLDVYGAGTVQAQQWVSRGYKDLNDLLKHAKLTPSQRVGVEHYDDFKQRIPREEVQRHGEVVIKAAKELDPDLQLEIMGSYRRGAKDCGDIDIMITKPHSDATYLNGIMAQLVEKLLKQDFLTVGLATPRKSDGSKWHGASHISPVAPWRRIDFLAVPWAERGAALLYFTGNDIFNRSLRLLASKKGYRLNQRGLYKNVMRGKNRVKITEGEFVEGESEKRIFEILGVPYRLPHERNC